LCGAYLTALVYAPLCVCTRNMNQVGASGTLIHIPPLTTSVYI